MALVPELKMNESETVAKRESKAEQEHLRFHDDEDYRRARRAQPRLLNSKQQSDADARDIAVRTTQTHQRQRLMEST